MAEDNVYLGVKVPESEVKPYQYDRANGIVGLMDRGGSNLAKINEQFKKATGDPIVRIIATTQPNHRDCRARERAEEFGIPLVDEVDFLKYEEDHGVKPGDYFWALQGQENHGRIKSKVPPDKIIQIRADVCNQFLEKLHTRMHREGINTDSPQFAAGCMSLLSADYVTISYVLNIHPGDLTKHHLNGLSRGKRCVVGDAWKPSALALLAGHDTLYSSIHRMIPEMDAGPVFMRGYGLPMDYNRLLSLIDIKDKKLLKQVGSAAQDALKHLGDHVIAGATFQDLFDGFWGLHQDGMLAYCLEGEWYLTPSGIKMDDHVANNPDTIFKRDPEFIEDKIEGVFNEIEKISLTGERGK